MLQLQELNIVGTLSQIRSNTPETISTYFEQFGYIITWFKKCLRYIIGGFKITQILPAFKMPKLRTHVNMNLIYSIHLLKKPWIHYTYVEDTIYICCRYIIHQFLSTFYTCLPQVDKHMYRFVFRYTILISRYITSYFWKLQIHYPSQIHHPLI